MVNRASDSPPSLDIAILGAGPAGVSAALHLARHPLVTALFDPAPPGGLTRAARRIDNLPGHPGGIAGRAFAALLAHHVEAANISRYGRRIAAVRRSSEGTFLLLAEAQQMVARARAVIVATGSEPRPTAGAFSETVDEALLARDATILPDDLSGSTVLVIGGGEAAVDTALSAVERGASTILACRRPLIRAHPRLLGELRDSDVEVKTSTILVSLAGAPGSLRARLSDGTSRVCRFALACIGRRPALPDLPPESERDGIFIAGDASGRTARYIAPALGDGIIAAESALRWIGIE